jgi:predicted cobalt transporter CbtA
MFRTIVFTSCLVGLLTGAILTGLQLVMTVPVILEAEKYEGSEHAAHEQPASVNEKANTKSNGAFSELYKNLYDFQHAESDWEPEDGWQRSTATLVANVLIAIAFSLLLVSALSLRPDPRWKEGLLWGLVGCAKSFDR